MSGFQQHNTALLMSRSETQTQHKAKRGLKIRLICESSGYKQLTNCIFLANLRNFIVRLKRTYASVSYWCIRQYEKWKNVLIHMHKGKVTNKLWWHRRTMIDSSRFELIRRKIRRKFSLIFVITAKSNALSATVVHYFQFWIWSVIYHDLSCTRQLSFVLQTGLTRISSSSCPSVDDTGLLEKNSKTLFTPPASSQLSLLFYQQLLYTMGRWWLSSEQCYSSIMNEHVAIMSQQNTV